MKKSYRVVHQEEEHAPFPLTPDQIEREYSLFGGALAQASFVLPTDMKDNYRWERIRSGDGIRLFLEGDHEADQMDAYTAEILSKVNEMLRRQPQVAYPTFIVAESNVVE